MAQNHQVTQTNRQAALSELSDEALQGLWSQTVADYEHHTVFPLWRRVLNKVAIAGSAITGAALAWIAQDRMYGHKQQEALQAGLNGVKHAVGEQDSRRTTVLSRHQDALAAFAEQQDVYVWPGCSASCQGGCSGGMGGRCNPTKVTVYSDIEFDAETQRFKGEGPIAVVQDGQVYQGRIEGSKKMFGGVAIPYLVISDGSREARYALASGYKLEEHKGRVFKEELPADWEAQLAKIANANFAKDMRAGSIADKLGQVEDMVRAQRNQTVFQSVTSLGLGTGIAAWVQHQLEGKHQGHAAPIHDNLVRIEQEMQRRGFGERLLESRTQVLGRAL